MKGLCRRLLLTLPIAMTMGSTLLAADFSIRNTVGSAGSSVTVTVNYRADRNDVAALQFDLLFDPAVLTMSSATVGQAAADAGKVLQSNLLSPGRFRVLIFGLNQTVIGSGSIAEITNEKK